MLSHIKAIVLFIGFISFTAQSQSYVSTAVPFLEISPSPEANAQGQTSVSRITDDPYAVNFNPAHLGFQDAQTQVAYSFYPSKTQWLPGLGSQGLTYDSYAVTGGMNLQNYLSIPLSLGVAYSRVELNYGTMSRTGINDLNFINTPNPEEHADAYSIGIGLDIGVRVAVGFTLRQITSDLGSYTIGNSLEVYTIGTVSAWSEDYGLLIDVPIVDLVAKETKLMPGISPLCDVSFGTALTNVGGKMTYNDQSQEDALPRTISVGTTIEIGIKYSPTNHKIFTFTWSRESNSLLVGYSDTIGTPYYRGGFDDISFVKNIVLGKQTTQTINGTSYAVTDLSQGWQINIGEILFIRGGSYQGIGDRSFTTEGFGIRASGIFKLLDDLMIPESSTLSFIADHFDTRYDQSKYIGGSLDNIKFSSLSIIVKL